MQNIKDSIIILATHTKLIGNQFVISAYQNKPLWSKAVLEEASYMLLITYVNLIQSHGINDKKKILIDKMVDEWTGVMTGFLNTANTPQSRMIIKQRLNEKSIKYTPVIEQMLGERLNNNHDDEIIYKYELYELFLEEMLDNFNNRACQRPEDGLNGAMSFINLSQDLKIISSEIFDEKSVVMLSLKYDDMNEITEHDKIAIKKNQNKKDIRKRSLVIRDGVVNFITQCIYHDLQNTNNSNNNDTSKSNNINLLDGYLNPMQYFLSAIIPCFLILAINDSMYLFPPNISIPIFSMGTKIRELTSGQDFWLWVSYLLAVINLLYVQVKRLNDSGSNPALCLVSFIPFFGALFAVSLAMTNFFPRQNDDEDIENDPYIGISYAVSVFALVIFLIVWSGATRWGNL